MLTLPLFSNAVAKPFVIGAAPPQLSWVTVAGDTLSWKELRQQRPLVMVFWATWCHSCKKEWPKLKKIASQFEGMPRAPVWASVSLGEAADRVAAEVAKRGLPGIALADPKEHNGKILGIEYIPAMCVLDPAGNVAYAGPANSRKLKHLLDELTSEPQPKPKE